jgi:type IV pilus assembly protein PilP
MMTILPLLMVMAAPASPMLSAPQAPMPVQAINAARKAKDDTETAQKKNSTALDPQPQPPSPPPAAGQGQQTAPAGQGQQPQGGYTYDPDGRRDPFVSLLYRGGEMRPAGGTRPPGVAGLLIGEVAVKGVLKGKGGVYIALLQAPDNKTYIVHQGDRLMDGSVKSVAADAVVFSQDVNDPLSLVKQREVRKTIRPETR